MLRAMTRQLDCERARAEALRRAVCALLRDRPATFAGLAALLAHVTECSRDGQGEGWKLPVRLLRDVEPKRRACFDGESIEYEEPSEPFAYFVMLSAIETIARLATPREA